MIIITAQEGVYGDVASTEWNGTTYSAKSSHGVTMALARKLVAAGCPDQPWQMVGPGSSMVRMHGRSIAWLATKTLTTVGGRLYVGTYKQNPRFPLRCASPDGADE